MFTITKWSQDQCTREKIPKKKKILTTSLINIPPNTKISYTNPPPMSKITLISKQLPLFVTSDKGKVH